MSGMAWRVARGLCYALISGLGVALIVFNYMEFGPAWMVTGLPYVLLGIYGVVIAAKDLECYSWKAALCVTTLMVTTIIIFIWGIILFAENHAKVTERVRAIAAVYVVGWLMILFAACPFCEGWEDRKSSYTEDEEIGEQRNTGVAFVVPVVVQPRPAVRVRQVEHVQIGQTSTGQQFMMYKASIGISSAD